MVITSIQSCSNQNLETKKISSELPWQFSCGSPPGNSSTWYIVFGPDSAFGVVKVKYCGDAFLTPSGNLQVASFQSYEEARNLAKSLSNATGYDFWVK